MSLVVSWRETSLWPPQRALALLRRAAPTLHRLWPCACVCGVVHARLPVGLRLRDLF